MVDPSPPTPDPGWRLAVPTLVTLGSVVCAATALYLVATSGWQPAQGIPPAAAHLAWAAWAILLAEVFDTVDGLVARLMRATSPFGLQLDSLADVLSFGVAPALLVAAASGGSLPGCAAALALVCCAVLRVARYNVEKPPVGPPPLYFKGLATPGAGGALASWVLLAAFFERGGFALEPALRASVVSGMAIALPGFALMIAALMVSNRRYPDLPKHYMRRVKPWWQPLLLVAFAVVAGPEPALGLFFIVYALSGLWNGKYA